MFMHLLFYPLEVFFFFKKLNTLGNVGNGFIKNIKMVMEGNVEKNVEQVS